MNPMQLVEEFPREYELTQFEKVLVAARRAKDLHNIGKAPLLETHHKSPYTALAELKAKKIIPAYREEEPPEIENKEGEDSEEEE